MIHRRADESPRTGRGYRLAVDRPRPSAAEKGKSEEDNPRWPPVPVEDRELRIERPKNENRRSLTGIVDLPCLDLRFSILNPRFLSGSLALAALDRVSIGGNNILDRPGLAHLAVIQPDAPLAQLGQRLHVVTDHDDKLGFVHHILHA